jgi:hypothetical protein
MQEKWSLEAWLYMFWAELEWKAQNRNPLEELLG